MARTKLQFYFLATGLALSAIFVGLVYRATLKKDKPDDVAIQKRGYLTTAIWAVASALPFISTLAPAIVCLHISCIRSSKYFNSVSAMLLGYVVYHLMRFSWVFIWYKNNQSIMHPRLTQETLLKDRLKRDIDTRYGKQHNFRNITSLAELRTQHPLTTYEHYADYVEKMANGEEKVMVNEKLLRFGITSGTTGKGKLIPITESGWHNHILYHLLWFPIAAQKFGWASPLQKSICLYVNPNPTTTNAGYVVGPMHLFTDDMKLYTNVYSTPWEVYSITTEFEATYLVLLFGLRDRDIGQWMGPFNSMIHKAMCLVEQNWKQLVADINTGTICQDLQISPEVRDACQKELSPEPERAQELKQEFEKGFDGIIRRVWPHVKYIVGVNTADFAERLENGYARGVPIFCPMYESTEGFYGINLWPGEDDRYVLLPNSVLFEFIAEKDINEVQPATLFIDEVQKGEAYELVVSTTSGFYRYRFGDVVKVVDFHYKTPVVKFMYRSGQLLNLRAEKVTELSVGESVRHIVSNWPEAKLNLWTSAESTILSKITDDTDEFEQGAQFYLVFIELEGNTSSIVLDDKHQQEFDDVLKQHNNYYRGYRNAGTISPPCLYLVKPGTFKSLRDYIIANSSASYNQYKVPRKLKNPHAVKLMLDARVCRP